MWFKILIKDLGSNKSSLLCVGLDPHFEDVPVDAKKSELKDYIKNIIDETIDYAACYKINSAYYEVRGEKGRKLLEYIPKYIDKRVPVILDAKRCDIPDSMKYY